MKTVENDNLYMTPECEVISIFTEESVLIVSPGGGEGTGDDEI